MSNYFSQQDRQGGQGGNFFRPRKFGFFSQAIKALLISNVVIFFGAGFLGQFKIGDFPLGNYLEYQFSLLPLEGGFQIWQLFTYMFLHADIIHLIFNMLPLWMFGSELEEMWGRKIYDFYLTCGVGAAVANLFFAPMFSQVGPTVGASGAVFGILIAFGLLFPDRLIFFMLIPIPIKAKYFVIYYIVAEIFSVGSVDNVAHIAHLGGAAVGLLMLMLDGSVRNPFSSSSFSSPMFKSQPKRNPFVYKDISDAKVYDEKIEPKKEEENNQIKIDEILDKISKGGYQSLTAEEKRFLFEASKKMS